MSKTIFALKDFTTCEEALTNRKAMHYNFTLYSLSLSSFMIRKLWVQNFASKHDKSFIYQTKEESKTVIWVHFILLESTLKVNEFTFTANIYNL